ncbi:MAG: bleomycin resistance protein [Gammaproteobacteria bacterium]|nr:bleomycin resistance protein [Gammaproteobacteria bacterium]
MIVDDIRYQCLGYLALNVTDLGESRHFYEALVGLKGDAPSANGMAFLRCSCKHHDILLIENATQTGLKRIGWQMESAHALAAVREQCQVKGLAIVDVERKEAELLGIGDAFRISDPTTGVTLEFYAQMHQAETHNQATHTQIQRLGHVVINSTDRDATRDFYLNTLNFKVSDEISGMVTFTRCFPNPYHHSLGLGSGAENCLNHINFMVDDLADIGKANNRIKQHGYQVVWGPGKHPPSESLFLYFLDPDGFTVEYSCGMEEFPEHNPRVARDMPAVMESLDYWGGIPGPDFGKKGCFEALAPSTTDTE